MSSEGLRPARSIIREAREDRGITLPEFAAQLGVSPDLVAKVERGERRLQWEYVQRAAEQLDLDLGDLSAGPHALASKIADLREQALAVLRDPDLVTGLLAFSDRRVHAETLHRLLAEYVHDRVGLIHLFRYSREVTLLPDGSTVRVFDREFEVVGERFSRFAFRRTIKFGKKTRHESASDFKVELDEDLCWMEGASYRLDGPHQEGNRVSYAVPFDPPLTRGDCGRIVARESYQDAYAITQKQLASRPRTTDVPIPQDFEYSEVTLHYPTDHLRLRYVLPEGFEIAEPGFCVWLREMPVEHEIKRLETMHAASARKIGPRWVLELNVDRPITGCSYAHIFKPRT